MSLNLALGELYWLIPVGVAYPLWNDTDTLYEKYTLCSELWSKAQLILQRNSQQFQYKWQQNRRYSYNTPRDIDCTAWMALLQKAFLEFFRGNSHLSFLGWGGVGGRISGGGVWFRIFHGELWLWIWGPEPPPPLLQPDQLSPMFWK